MLPIIVNYFWLKCKKKVVVNVIRFDRLWVTLQERNISQYKLIKDYGIDKSQLHRLRDNMIVKTWILDRLCQILNCRIEDIMEYVPDEPNKAGTPPKK